MRFCLEAGEYKHTEKKLGQKETAKLFSFFFFPPCIFRGTKSAHGENEPREFSTVADYTDFACCLKSAVGDAVLLYL